jgi:hypothetical protein
VIVLCGHLKGSTVEKHAEKQQERSISRNKFHLLYDVKQVALISNAFLGHLTPGERGKKSSGSKVRQQLWLVFPSNFSEKLFVASLHISCEARQIINKLNYTNFQALTFQCSFGERQKCGRGNI